jgi:signal transduction histidine kinase
LRERALGARAEADHARNQRERLLIQMREANERLVLATLRADELAEQADLARAAAAEAATLEAEGRRRAENLATQLRASDEALRSSEADARASIRAKDEFLAMLAHELRSPLAAIQLALDMIELGPTDPHRRALAVIERQMQQLVRLVDDLLEVARIRSGKIALEREPVEMCEVVSRALEGVKPMIDSKHHELVVEVPERGLVVDGDVLRLAQVVGNLLTNAAKYTPAGGSIRVTGERRDANIVLRVRDNGIGISAEMLPRVFDLFAQEQQAHDHAGGGLGLGLAIVRTMVGMHGGTVTAHSEGLGRGSEFVVELPAATAAERAR